MIEVIIKGDILADPKKLKKEIRKLDKILRQLEKLVERNGEASYGGTDPEWKNDLRSEKKGTPGQKENGTPKEEKII